MYHRVRKKMTNLIVISAILLLAYTEPTSSAPKSLETTTAANLQDDAFDNQIVDFDEEYTVKFNKKYGMVPWHANDFKNSHKYTIFKNSNVKDEVNNEVKFSEERDGVISKVNVTEYVTTEDYSVIPLELISTTEDALTSITESTTEQDLTVIPLATTKKTTKVTTSTEDTLEFITTTESTETTTDNISTTTIIPDFITQDSFQKETTKIPKLETTTNTDKNDTIKNIKNPVLEDYKINTQEKLTNKSLESKEEDIPIFTELDTEDDQNIPEDYYDSKDVVPTPAPKTDAISVLFGLAGSVVESVVESVAEKVVPKGIFDLFKRIQRQQEALEAERLRSPEENGGLGQFGRGILKTISTGLSKPITQLMTTAKEAGSLDTDRGFVASVASGVTSVANVANSVVDAFKDKVQAIYPGTVWCGDGHSANARSSSDLGLFFFTDTCCRQHDACKIYIRSGENKYGLNNTGLFTRSHCSCDSKFRECLRRTNSLVSAQIGLTYFNVLGPQCFRRAHPIVRCMKRTRITGQKCEEYELDYTKPKMWQWFDNETF